MSCPSSCQSLTDAGGDTITLRAGSARKRYTWVTDIERASRKCRETEKHRARLKLVQLDESLVVTRLSHDGWIMAALYCADLRCRL